MSEERRIQELGRPGALHTEGMVEHANNKEGCLTVRRESDQLIVLGGRESRLHVPVVITGHGEGEYGHA